MTEVQTEKEEKVITNSFGAVYCFLVNLFTMIFYGWMTVEMGWPAVEFIQNQGVPSKPEVWISLFQVVQLALIPMILAFVCLTAALHMRKRSPGAAAWQAFLSSLMLLAYPWGTLIHVPALYFALLDPKTRKAVSAGMVSWIALIAGVVAAGTLYAMGLVWMFDVPGALERISGQAKQQSEERFGQDPQVELPFKGWMNQVTGIFKSSPAEDGSSGEPSSLLSFGSGSDQHEVILKSGSKVSGWSLRQGDNGFYVKTQDYGDVFFGLHEVQSIDGQDPAAFFS